MAESLYSIVIPTRERADTLHFAIATVLRLARTNYELIVADNFGSPETKRVVDAYSSPRIRYVRAPERLAMADNWELGLAQARGDYVTFLGDDDGLLPDALDIAGRFHEGRPGRILGWKPFAWVWPDAVAPEYRNLAQMHFGDHAERIDSRGFLKALFAGREDWTTLPTLYCSFVPRAMIEKFRSQHGRYFLESLPDVFSGIANLIGSEDFHYCYRPLSCWGLSRHSTGAGQFFQMGEELGRFDRERRSELDPWHPRLSGAERIVEVRVADLYLKARERLFPDDDELRLDMAALLKRIAASAGRFRSGWEEVERAVGEMARKNGLDPADFPVAPPAAPGLDRFGYASIPARRPVVTYHCFTDPGEIATIADFVAHAARLTVPPERVSFVDEEEAPANGRAGLPRRIARRARAALRRALGPLGR